MCTHSTTHTHTEKHVRVLPDHAEVLHLEVQVGHTGLGNVLWVNHERSAIREQVFVSEGDPELRWLYGSQHCTHMYTYMHATHHGSMVVHGTCRGGKIDGNNYKGGERREGGRKERR